ncbi:hypothetical protein [Companilactobacillus keshanensis]|uniref:Uncharacterized protein n=1 Tax=Companilactobacillus keshanensis TaxID=2486003 RepID=A0ABW4BW72_9LACO|nr:hypothetical protein [Companilactobacillus keshanensis]
MNDLKYLSKSLQNWISKNGEKIVKVGKVHGQYSYRIETDHNIYYWDFVNNELFLQNDTEFSRVLYPNRAIETSLWGD